MAFKTNTVLQIKATLIKYILSLWQVVCLNDRRYEEKELRSREHRAPLLCSQKTIMIPENNRDLI